VSNGRSFGRRRQKRTPTGAKADERIAYGGACSWWDSIYKVGATSTGLPCCPRCGGVLYEKANEAEWWADVDRFERSTSFLLPYAYRALMEWARGRCYPSFDALRAAYEETLT
jgi:hypothetical protein